jgi:hypothetical protein
MNRDEAMQALEAHGLHVKQRTWSLGDTIFVGALLCEADDIKLYKVGLYLYPDSDDEVVWTNFAVPSPDTKCASLEEAVAVGAERVLAEARRIEAEHE